MLEQYLEAVLEISKAHGKAISAAEAIKILHRLMCRDAGLQWLGRHRDAPRDWIGAIQGGRWDSFLGDTPGAVDQLLETKFNKWKQEQEAQQTSEEEQDTTGAGETQAPPSRKVIVKQLKAAAEEAAAKAREAQLKVATMALEDVVRCEVGDALAQVKTAIEAGGWVIGGKSPRPARLFIIDPPWNILLKTPHDKLDIDKLAEVLGAVRDDAVSSPLAILYLMCSWQDIGAINAAASALGWCVSPSPLIMRYANPPLVVRAVF